MITRSWIRRLFDRKPRTVRKAPARRRPAVEALEDRTLLSPVVATTTSQLIGDIVAANNGTGPTTIQLQAADATNGFDFTAAYNSTQSALPQITASITIEGTSGFTNIIQRSTATGTPAFRLFDVASGGSLNMQNLTLEGGLAQGTGTAADGGAVYSSGTLTLSGVTVQSNRAMGSAGANATQLGASGGTGASAYGGGVYVNGGAVTLTHDTFSGNTALGGGGGNGAAGVAGVAGVNFGIGGTGGGGGGGGVGSGGALYAAAGIVTLS